MKIICVAGGSYKSFYLNYFIKLNKCDLLVFNFGIIYDYDICQELLKQSIVTKELMSLSNKLKTIVVAGINVISKDKNTKAIIVCDGEKINIVDAKIGAKIFIKGKCFVVGAENTNYKNYNKIVLSKKRIYPILSHCSKRKIYLFCDNFGVCIIENGILKRKFNKFSKFILK